MRAILTALITFCLLALNSNEVSAGSVLEIGDTTKTHSVVIVSASGTDVQNGKRLIDALKEVESSEHTLIKLEPGIYDVEGQALYMKPKVDLEGSGKQLTYIIGNASACEFCAQYGVLHGSNFSEVRDLTIINQQKALDGIPITVVNQVGGQRYTNVDISAIAANKAEVTAIGMLNIDAGNVYLNNVKITVGGGTESYGIKNIRSSPLCINVSISVRPLQKNSEAYGIYNEDTSLNVGNSYISAGYADLKCYAIYSVSNNPGIESNYVRWSEIIAGGGGTSKEIAGVYADGDQYFIFFSTSINVSTNHAVAGDGHFKCTGCANGEYDPLDSDCSEF